MTKNSFVGKVTFKWKRVHLNIISNIQKALHKTVLGIGCYREKQLNMAS